VAAWQQLMMTFMPPLTRYAESLGSNDTLQTPN
jgi:hypothetical protein